ncbi:putative uncharacterized protein dd2 [Fasciola hepatica]|uniref:FHAP protein n=1 Tax=Fasciola hepatica TaxID=6192 RepID=Q24939_FASHE|nr:amoebapore homolog [Fasciola hepatica]THD20233.1 putative uncharacterized protein dd2 [Fasciola hepatica]
MNPLFVLVLAAVALASTGVESEEPHLDISLCESCTNTVNLVKRLLQNSVVETHIRYLVKYLCKGAGSSQDACIKFIQYEVDGAVGYLIQHNATDICHVIRLC